MNQNPLKQPINELNTEEIDTSSFPEIENFSVSADNGLEFKSDSQGVLTTFPYFDNVDDAIPYLPSDQIPGVNGEWDELDQGWRVRIFTKGEYIVVLEANDPFSKEIESYYKVKLDAYKKAWDDLIKKYPSKDKAQWKGWWKN
jgi:hypothetical protein